MTFDENDFRIKNRKTCQIHRFVYLVFGLKIWIYIGSQFYWKDCLKSDQLYMKDVFREVSREVIKPSDTKRIFQSGMCSRENITDSFFSCICHA